MTIDMTQFYQIFFDETEEHLACIESLLVAMNPAAPDPEDLAAVFRAAHSIKGSSGTFGFDDMMAVTHVMETLLDRVRKGEAALTPEMVDACLSAGDVLRAQLDGHKGKAPADPAAARQVCQRLEALCAALDAPVPQPAPAPEPAPRPAALVTSPVSRLFAQPCLLLRFMPDGMVVDQSGLLDNLVDELGRLGSIEHIDRPPAQAPHGMWCIRMRTDVPPEVLRETINFLAEPGSVHIEPADGDGRDAAAAPTVRDAADSMAMADEPAYGFFEPLPAGAADAGQEFVAEDGSFGLFAPLADPAEAPVATAPETDPAPEAEPAQEAGRGRAASGDSSIRVSVEKVDQMINLVGELVITQAMLQQSAHHLDPVVFERIMAGLTQLERNTRDLQESVMSMRMMPISTVFTRFPRVVRDLSRKLGKAVELKTRGEATELDRGLIERIADPLTHLVRNSLDHGIEPPEAREAAGKPATGIITLSAAHQGGNVVIEVADDGAGLDRARILAKARERGLAAPDGLSDAEVWQLIFEPGFSTAAQVTELSGRGVGMDVVRRNITALGGRVDIDSAPGRGTRMTVRLPLTLAILDGMSVRVGSETYIVPLTHVVESLQADPQMIRSVAGVHRLIQVRGEYLTVVPLHQTFGVEGAQTCWSEGIMVVLEADGNKAALLVDELLGQHQVVIKSLETNFRRVPGVSGATIMGDGRVAMILDAPGLVEGARRRMAVAA
jgi:two-component system chemotaxis sensor kinase CheA